MDENMIVIKSEEAKWGWNTKFFNLQLVAVFIVINVYYTEQMKKLRRILMLQKGCSARKKIKNTTLGLLKDANHKRT